MLSLFCIFKYMSAFYKYVWYIWRKICSLKISMGKTMSWVFVGVGEGGNNTFNPPDVLLFFLFLALFHFSSSFFWFYGPLASWAFELWLRTSREEPLFFILPRGVFYWGGETCCSRYEIQVSDRMQSLYQEHSENHHLCTFSTNRPA